PRRRQQRSAGSGTGATTPTRDAHHAVTIGVSIAVTTTLAATRTVAAAAAGAYAGLALATIAGTAAALPAVDAAAMPATPLPPLSRSASHRTPPVNATTNKPNATPSMPACQTLRASIVVPRVNEKNGISTGT